jgi:GTPase SAR1 family protein
MRTKIILVGPPAAGKTTIRKLFFEGENSSNLLEYALQPTFGEESLIFRTLKEEIGIFDLAGQENERWLESNEKAIFNNTKSIIVIIEISEDIEKILNFIDKVIHVKKEMSSSAHLFVLIHKIDLKTQFNLKRIKKNLNNQIKKRDIQKLYFTSIKEKYFTHTFGNILEILRLTLSESINSKLIGSELLKAAVKALYYIKTEVLDSAKELQLKLNLTNQEIKTLIDHLISKEMFEYSQVDSKGDQKTLLKLTSKGLSQIEYFSENLHLDDLLQSDTIIKKVLERFESIPPFIGYLISDSDGKTLAIVELEENLLTSILENQTEREDADQSFDIELIPMFISALEKFSKEINIQDLSDFSLNGINLNMHIYNFHDFVVTLFLNPNTHIKPLEYFIKNHFIDLFKKYEEEFALFVDHGSLSIRERLKEEESEWLNELNDSYKRDQFNLDYIDLQNAKELYQEIDKLQEKIEMHHSIELKKVKTLKINFMKVLLKDNLKAVKDIAKKIQDLKIKYHIN